MAKKDDQKSKRQARSGNSKPTVRELSKNSRSTSSSTKKSGRVRRAARKASSPLSKFRAFGARQYQPIKLPDNKAGKIMNKPVRIFPKFLSNAWAEIRQVTWPNRRDTIRLSLAVFVFAAIFAVIVSFLDLGLDKIFREFIIKV